MKTTFTKFLLISLAFMLICEFSNAQIGLDSVIVEKYYKSNAADSIASVGILPVGSVTYRIYVSMLPGYKFQMAYGNANHPLSITTTSSFFNNEDRGSITPNFTKAQAKFNTIMLDSWLSSGAACTGNFGILKSKDNGVSTVVNGDGVLQNADTSVGIPLTQQDGFITGTPGVFGTIGADINAAISVFDATSQTGNSFLVNDGAWYCLAGASGPDTNNNQVLIAQITTKGRLRFKLNIQIGTPTGGIEKYVAENPQSGEFKRNYLSFVSDSVVTTGINEMAGNNNQAVTIFPNPSNGIYALNISGNSLNTENFYTIYNILGNSIFKKKINMFSNAYQDKIDLTSYPKGIYFIELSINGSKTTHKLIKN
jgi:hypothetical protein